MNNWCVRGEHRVKEDLALSIRTEVDCPEKDTMQLDCYNYSAVCLAMCVRVRCGTDAQ